MSTGIKERLESLANPMLVRQMYQSLHSRKFLGALWLMLLASLLTYVTVFVATEGGEAAGGAMFSVFGFVLFLAALLVLPYMAFTNLREEVESRTIELIQITCLDARRQVRGRLQAALSRLILLYSVIGPFAVVAFLFGGVGLESILLTLYTLLILSCLAVSLGIFFAALSSVQHMSHVARWIYFGVLILTLLVGGQSMVGMLVGMGRGGWMGSGRGVLAYVAVTGVEGTLTAWFLCAAAANLLTFEANKSSGRTRFILLLMLLSGFALCGLLIGGLLMYSTGSYSSDFLIVLEIYGALALAGCSMIWLTGDRRVPSAVRKKLEQKGVLYRLVRYPFIDGPGGATAYLLLAGALIAGGVLLALAAGVRYSEEVTFVSLIFALAYAPYLSSCTWGLTRLFPAGYRNPVLRRGVLLGLAVCHALIAILWFAADLGSGGSLDIDAANPVAGLFPLVYLPSVLDDGAEPLLLLSGLSIVLVVGLLPHMVISVLNLTRHLSGKYE